MGSTVKLRSSHRLMSCCSHRLPDRSTLVAHCGGFVGKNQILLPLTLTPYCSWWHNDSTCHQDTHLPTHPIHHQLLPMFLQKQFLALFHHFFPTLASEQNHLGSSEPPPPPHADHALDHLNEDSGINSFF